MSAVESEFGAFSADVSFVLDGKHSLRCNVNGGDLSPTTFSVGARAASGKHSTLVVDGGELVVARRCQVSCFFLLALNLL